jgi:arylsulfatase A-like enzyme
MADRKPNILVIFGDDIGWSNISAYNHGLMGYQTPNLDRLAEEGALFTDAYGEQSCTAGRASFILGQHPVRTGLLTIGMPGSPHGIADWMPTTADLLKNHGYATGQFGKNHLGDQDQHLPTAHGFDEFFGNLYHLNAEEEPEGYYYPKDPEFRQRYGPRGVLHAWANPDGTQRIENTGPLTKKRMETVDEEIYGHAAAFIDRAAREDTPFFVWFNTTRMHVWTHLKPESIGRTGIGLYPDGMVEHDDMIGDLLKKLDDLGVADNTIVVYTTDNGAEAVTWPDGGITPFHGEKGTTWEGGALAGRHPAGYADQRDRVAARLAADAAGGGRGAGRQGEAARRPPGQREDLPRASRRLQPAALLHGRGRQRAARGDLLLQPGRRTERGALE